MTTSESSKFLNAKNELFNRGNLQGLKNSCWLLVFWKKLIEVSASLRAKFK